LVVFPGFDKPVPSLSSSQLHQPAHPKLVAHPNAILNTVDLPKYALAPELVTDV
jgi:hypothetical protein